MPRPKRAATTFRAHHANSPRWQSAPIRSNPTFQAVSRRPLLYAPLTSHYLQAKHRPSPTSKTHPKHFSDRHELPRSGSTPQPRVAQRTLGYRTHNTFQPRRGYTGWTGRRPFGLCNPFGVKCGNGLAQLPQSRLDGGFSEIILAFN